MTDTFSQSQIDAAIEVARRELAENDLYFFLQEAWHEVEGGKPFVGGWAIQALCLPYETEIITRDGNKSIGDIVESGYDGEVLSYTHSSNVVEWKKIKNRMKNSSHPLYDMILSDGSVLSLTDEHPVYIEGRGYARAEDIRISDAVLQAVWQEVPPQSSKSAWRILRQKMCWKSKGNRRKIQMPNLRWENCMGKPKVLPKMLCRISEKGCFKKLRGLQKRVLCFSKWLWKEILRESLFGKGKFWRKSRPVYTWFKKAKIRVLISFGKEKNIRTRWKQMFSLFCSRKNGCSSHRQGQDEQRALEFSSSLSKLSQSSKRYNGGNFKVSKSYVTSIKRSLRIPEAVYNIEVGDNNNYFANGILVHNCEHAEELYYGRIKRLVINVPPRMTKSTVFSVVFPVWCWIKNPGEQLMTISYAEKLAKRDNVKARRLIKSDWFQKRWGDRFQLSDDQDTKERVDNMQGGYRVVVGMDSGIVGEGSNCVVGNTMVTTDKGQIAIKKLSDKIGKVKIACLDSKNKVSYSDLQAWKVSDSEELIDINIGYKKLTCTPEHLIMVSGKGYIPASQVNFGDVLCIHSDGLAIFCLDVIGYKVVSVNKRVVKEKVYDIQVADNHNFFANNILVHNCMILDDANSTNNMSEASLESSLSVYTDVLPTRFNDLKTGRMCVVQQRVHERDISGWIIANQPEFVKLILPMEFEVARKCTTVPLKSTNGKPWTDPRTEEGELLMPNRVGQKELKSLKNAMASEYIIAGQLQQRPSPQAGGMIKKAWFQQYKSEFQPKIKFTIQSWDTASSIRKEAAYSAATTWGIFDDDQGYPSLILLGAWRKRVEFPELYETVQRMGQDYRATTKDRPINTRFKPDLILVEEKSTGIPLIQTLNKAGLNLTAWRPDKYGDKIERVRRVTHLLEAGRVYVPMQGPDFTRMKKFAEVLVNQCLVFPAGESRDFTDTMTQVLQRIINSGWILHPMEEQARIAAEFERDMTAPQEKAFY